MVGALATAGIQTAHAILAARGEWITNEKRLRHRAGLRGLDAIVAGVGPQPATLERVVVAAEQLFRSADPGCGPGDPGTE